MRTDLPRYAHSALGRKVLGSLVPVICPPQFVHLADEIVAHVGLTVGASPLLVRKAFTAGLVTYDLAALPFHRRRAHQLTGDAAERYYASWEHGVTPLHVQFAKAVNQLVSLSCYEQPEVIEAIGYHPGPWIDEVTQRRLAVYDAEARAQEARLLAPDPLRPGVRVDELRKRRQERA